MKFVRDEIGNLFEALDAAEIQAEYVEKEEGKALSSNDYTDEDKQVVQTMATGSVTGVKGDKENNYRTGNVNITPSHIGAATETALGNERTEQRNNFQALVALMYYHEESANASKDYVTGERFIRGGRLAEALRDISKGAMLLVHGNYDYISTVNLADIGLPMLQRAFSKGQFTGDIDTLYSGSADSGIISGIYWVSSSVASGTMPQITGYFHLLVMGGIQVYFLFNTGTAGKVGYRTYANSHWTPWHVII